MSAEMQKSTESLHFLGCPMLCTRWPNIRLPTPFGAITVYSNFIVIQKVRVHMSNKIPRPDTVNDLTVCRERSRTEINEFLESDLVDHQLGSVPGWKASFGARDSGDLVAVCVLSRPVAREIDSEKTISIARFATIPTRPQNTGSWLIARAREWARLEGYEELIAYAGVAGNYGTIYEASGFELVKEEEASGNGWNTRENRRTVSDFTRRKWRYSLD